MSQTNELPPPARMLQMITGHWISQTVAALARLAIPDAVADLQLSSSEIAAKCGTHADATYRLLRAAAGLGLFVEVEPDVFKLTPVGATLRANISGSMRDFAIAETDQGHWLAWGKLTDSVKTGERGAPKALGKELFEWYQEHPQDAAAFGGAMTSLASMVAGEVAASCDFSKAKTVVDIGGSHGTLLAAVLRNHSQLSGIVFDLPGVAERARIVLFAEGLASRAEVVAGDFFVDVPKGDIYLLKQVLHDWNDEQCRIILSLCSKRMTSSGRVCIVEMVIPDDNSPSMASMMDLNMLVMLPGRERSLKEYRSLLESVGLQFERLLTTHSPFQIIEASKR
jgi:hypothetical protein